MDDLHDHRELSRRLADVAARLGELTLTQQRLLEGRNAASPGAVDGAGHDHDPDADLRRRDRLAYLETVRAVLHRLLFVIDFTLVHERLDRALLRDARACLVDGVDAVDACRLLDGVRMRDERLDE